MKEITPAQKGLITGALMVTASLFSLYILKYPFESYFQFIVYSIFCLGILWGLITYSKKLTEKKSFKDYFSVGFKTFIVICLVMAVFTYIYFNLNTGFRDEKIAENTRLLVLQGDHLPKEIEDNSKQLKKMFMPMMISSAVFRYLILGALITIITAGFLSRKNTTVASK
ncbi:MAG: DUF4199 domain-containing protein [Ferruginibacter sp.]|nr:DUF4199 domain-containing protein [Ferruginibacter sp.]